MKTDEEYAVDMDLTDALSMFVAAMMVHFAREVVHLPWWAIYAALGVKLARKGWRFWRSIQ
jgi:hypothetical protein